MLLMLEEYQLLNFHPIFCFPAFSLAVQRPINQRSMHQSFHLFIFPTSSLAVQRPISQRSIHQSFHLFIFPVQSLARRTRLAH